VHFFTRRILSLTAAVILIPHPSSLIPNPFALRFAYRRVSELVLMKEDDMGATDEQVTVRSHIGYLCKAGDVVLGYNLRDTNIVECDDEGGDDLGNQDVLVVRKLYGGVARGDKDAARQR